MKSIPSTFKELQYQPALDAALEIITIPDGYELRQMQTGIQNSNAIWVFRYEKANGRNNGLGGEHFSFVVDQSTLEICGFTWMDQKLANGNLPSKEETKEIAGSFIGKISDKLFQKLENLWIEPHIETIIIDNHHVEITGMKYKCYLREEDTYCWVIVGPKNKVITFEQGIKWVNGRVTEKWLHDRWLIHTQKH